MSEDFVQTSRYEREMGDLRAVVSQAQQAASTANQSIAGHEQVCALRYETINTKLADVPRIFDAINALNKNTNIQAGMWKMVLGVSVVLGIVSCIAAIAYTLSQLGGLR